MAPREEVERRIYFYVADIGIDDSGHLKPFDPTRVLKRIRDIPGDSLERRLPLPEDRATYCWVDDLRAPQRGRVATIRRSGFPSVERMGTLAPLYIQEDSGLADQIHIVFFEKYGARVWHGQPR